MGQPDLAPPVLCRVYTETVRSARFIFDEPTNMEAAGITVDPDIPVQTVLSEENSVTVVFATLLQPGMEIVLRGEAKDAQGNSTFFIARFYGFNPNPARLVINEFITRGSDTHPDLVELKVLQAGSLAGICFCHGTRDNYAYRYVFPACNVAEGDLILLHTRPQGISSEQDELADITASGGLDASPNARDFWLAGGPGLSGNNGVVAVYEQPAGNLMDVVIYTNRTSASDTAYRGFGSKDLMSQADQLCEERAWVFSGDMPAPEDAVTIELSTATRSICRTSTGADTDSKADWHIVPTRGSTFGGINSDAVYTP